MKKLFLVLIGLALLIFGCAGKTVKDCETDQDCFKEASKTCTPAKVKNSQSGMTMEALVNGFEGDNCIMNFKITESQAVPLFKDKEMTCKIPKASLGDFDTGSSGGNKMLDWCSGSFVDLIKSFGVAAGGATGGTAGGTTG